MRVEGGQMYVAISRSITTPLCRKGHFFRSKREKYFLQILLHELAHLYLRTKHPSIIEAHGQEFRKFEWELCPMYGLKN